MLDLGVPIAFAGRACYLPDADALVLADLHVGRAEASAVSLPLGERADLHDRLVDLCNRFSPATVVFAGDVLHTFSTATNHARETLDTLAAACRDRGARVVPVAGNHDTMLGEVWDGEVCETYRLSDGTLVCHGHAKPDAAAPRYVVGHDHPAIEIEGQRHPCLLYGEGAYRDGDLFVLPAFSPLAAGAVVNGMAASDFDSPLVRRVDALRPAVEEGDDVLVFPPLGEFRRLL
jgi:hypothetical protein